MEIYNEVCVFVRVCVAYVYLLRPNLVDDSDYSLNESQMLNC